MALKPCKSCKHQVDTTAKTCPNCGVANPGVTGGSVLGGMIMLAVVAFLVVKCVGGGDEKQVAKPKVDPATCMKDLKCWGEKYLSSASVYCKTPVEKLAKYSARWTDGTFEMKFSHYRWKNQAQGIVTYIGDKIEFQNGFGAFQPHIYECDFNPATNAVLAVKASPGRLR